MSKGDRPRTRLSVRCLVALLVLAIFASLGSPATAGNTVGGVAQNAVIANGNGMAVTVFGTFLVATYVVSGTFVATVNFEGSGQDGSFQSLGCVPVISGATVSSTTTTGAWRCNIVGMIQIRARVSGYTSGSVTASIQASDTGTVLVGPATDTVSSSILTNPTINGVVTGTPTWNSAQTFPGLRDNGGLGVNRAPPATAGQIAATNAANSGTMVTLTRNTDTSPAGNFLDFQNAAASSVFTLGITGKVTTYGGVVASDGQVMIAGTAAGNYTAANLTAGTGIVVTNGNNAVTVAATSTPAGPIMPTVLVNSSAYAAISNTAAESYFAIAADGKIAAGSVNAAKRRVEIELRGVFGSLATDSVTLKIKLCTVSGCGSGTVVTLGATAATGAVAVTNAGWEGRLVFNVFTIGASGTADAQGMAIFATAATTAAVAEMQNTGTSTVDWTVDEYISASVTWTGVGVPSATDTIQLRNFGATIY